MDIPIRPPIARLKFLPFNYHEMLGIILCGGASTRMGNDKGLLKQEARTWAQTAFEKLSTLNIAVRFSVNNQQKEAYQKIFSDGDLIVDNTDLSVHGPLLGVLTAHQYNPNQDLFLLACDLPLMDETLLKELFTLSKTNSSYDVFIYSNDNEPEPLCGIYTATGLQKIMNLYAHDKLTRHSMKFMLDHLSVCKVPLTESQKKAFRNFNAHADLNGM